MGCSHHSRPVAIRSIVAKSRGPLIIRVETNNTLNMTNVISRIPSVKLQNLQEKACVKINILNEFSPFILDEPHASDSLSKKLSNIRKFWLLFKANQSYFETAVHGVCIANYSVVDGLLVLAISAIASRGLSSLTVQKEVPFIICQGEFDKETGEIVKAWNEFSNIIALIVTKNVTKKIESYLDLLNENLANCDMHRGYYLRKGIKVGGEFLGDVRVTLRGIEEFVEHFEDRKEQIVNYANELRSIEKFGSKTIVHYVIR